MIAVTVTLSLRVRGRGRVRVWARDRTRDTGTGRVRVKIYRGFVYTVPALGSRFRIGVGGQQSHIGELLKPYPHFCSIEMSGSGSG